MKTTKKISAAITNTTLLSRIVLMIVFCFPSLLYGQWEKEVKLFSFENKDVVEYELTSFKCRSIEGENYIMWTVLEPSNECIYVLERSGDNKIYSKIYAVKGGKSPNYIELLNSFTDEAPLKGTSYYRIRRFSKETAIVSRPYVVNRTI